MKLRTYTKSLALPVSAEEAFAWHARSGALRRLIPPWERIKILMHEGIRDGARAEFRLRVGPFWLKWIAEHQGCIEGRQFEDLQIHGPFRHWLHRHTITPEEAGGCRLEDRVEYAVPIGFVGDLFGHAIAHKRFERMFAFRHTVTSNDINTHAKYQDRPRMKILISGATGLVGTQLSAFLTTGGHEVVALTRGESGEKAIHWEPNSGELDASQLAGFDAVVHLAGENVAGRWTKKKKKRIRDSRVNGTRLLAEKLSELDEPPKSLICASAIGYYGSRGDEIVDESSKPDDDFLAEVCQEWEAAADPARDKGIRVVHLRIGVVLSPNGGALGTILTPFKLGVGGVVGGGKQYMSWIAIDDVVGAIHHALMTESLTGPVNAVAPNPATNREFTKTLGKVLNRPTIFPLPAFAIRLGFGEMGEALLLSSTRVEPKRLKETDYEFRFADLEEALRHLLGR